jgi:hypothetical protein
MLILFTFFRRSMRGSTEQWSLVQLDGFQVADSQTTSSDNGKRQSEDEGLVQGYFHEVLDRILGSNPHLGFGNMMLVCCEVRTDLLLIFTIL